MGRKKKPATRPQQKEGQRMRAISAVKRHLKKVMAIGWRLKMAPLVHQTEDVLDWFKSVTS